jgi:hypothetical protein
VVTEQEEKQGSRASKRKNLKLKIGARDYKSRSVKVIPLLLPIPPLSTEGLKRESGARKKEKSINYKKQFGGSVINWRVGLSLLR